MKHQNGKKPADPTEDEFFRMFTLYQRRIYAFIRSMVPNSSDADDLFQETSLRLWDQRTRYEPGTNFVAWACTIARYQVITYRKTKAREKLHYSDKFLQVVASKMEEEDLDARQAALASCMDKLSSTNAMVLRAFYAPHAVAQQVGERFGRSADAIYQTVSRVRRILHDCIEKQAEEA